jgi:hypothetical protein
MLNRTARSRIGAEIFVIVKVSAASKTAQMFRFGMEVLVLGKLEVEVNHIRFNSLNPPGSRLPFGCFLAVIGAGSVRQ